MKQNNDRIIHEINDHPPQENQKKNPVVCLLIDDVAMNLKVLAALVKKVNGTPVVVSSAEEAVDLLQKCKINLILTDLWMPNMNGLEFAKTIRCNPEYDDIPIIAVTADSECDTNFDMQYFDDIFVKPVTLEMLQNRLRQYILE